MAHRDIEQATQHAEHLTELLGQKDATSSGLAVLEKGKASLEGEVRRLNRVSQCFCIVLGWYILKCL